MDLNKIFHPEIIFCAQFLEHFIPQMLQYHHFTYGLLHTVCYIPYETYL